jgi:hypothetical protein
MWPIVRRILHQGEEHRQQFPDEAGEGGVRTRLSTRKGPEPQGSRAPLPIRHLRSTAAARRARRPQEPRSSGGLYPGYPSLGVGVCLRGLRGFGQPTD